MVVLSDGAHPIRAYAVAVAGDPLTVCSALWSPLWCCAVLCVTAPPVTVMSDPTPVVASNRSTNPAGRETALVAERFFCSVACHVPSLARQYSAVSLPTCRCRAYAVCASAGSGSLKFQSRSSGTEVHLATPPWIAHVGVSGV